MAILTLIRKILPSLFILNVVQKYKGSSELVKIRAAQAYILGIEKMRRLFLGILFTLLSLLLLGSGLFLVHTAIFTYSAWSPQTKFIIALVFGVVEFSGAVIVLFYLFSEETWSNFYGIQNVFNSVVKKEEIRRKK